MEPADGAFGSAGLRGHCGNKSGALHPPKLTRRAMHCPGATTNLAARGFFNVKPGPGAMQECFAHCLACGACHLLSIGLTASPVCIWYRTCETLPDGQLQGWGAGVGTWRTWRLRRHDGSYETGVAVRAARSFRKIAVRQGPSTVYDSQTPTAVFWRSSWPLQDEETCEYRFHILTAALACPAQQDYVFLEVGAGFGYWTDTHLAALRRLNPGLVGRVHVHVVDVTHSVDECVRAMLDSNRFKIANLSVQRTLLIGTRHPGSLTNYLKCQKTTPPSPRHSCTFNSGVGAGARCQGTMADVLEAIPGEIDVIDIDIQGYEGLALTPEALSLIADRVKAVFIAPHEMHTLHKRDVRPGTQSVNHKTNVLALYDTFSSGVWRAICVQHPTVSGNGSDPAGEICDGVVAALNTKYYTVQDVNATHVRVANRGCGRDRTVVVPLMTPFASWPYISEPLEAQVKHDAIFQLWGEPWMGWRKDTDAATFMGLRFPSELMSNAYRGEHRCYRHKTKWLTESDHWSALAPQGLVATMPETWVEGLLWD